MAKARVAVLKTQPESVLEDVGRTMELAEVKRHLAPGAGALREALRRFPHVAGNRGAACGDDAWNERARRASRSGH